jgi:hypothetical protein
MSFGGFFMGDYRTHAWNGFAIDAAWMTRRSLTPIAKTRSVAFS